MRLCLVNNQNEINTQKPCNIVSEPRLAEHLSAVSAFLDERPSHVPEDQH